MLYIIFVINYILKIVIKNRTKTLSYLIIKEELLIVVKHNFLFIKSCFEKLRKLTLIIITIF